jgi:murein DD-endopeptidase MepM/ murein hydrolase activator NlpD
MKRFSKYIYNPKTLLYEVHEDSKTTIAFKVIGFVFTVLAFATFYFLMYTKVFNMDLPKTARLKKQNEEWVARFEVLNHSMDAAESSLDGIEKRDDDVYRSIFGLSEVPEEVKKAGFGGVNRYAYLDELGGSFLLKQTVKRLDVLTKRAYVQSQALDEVSVVSKHVDKLASCMPSVSPIKPVIGSYRISSPFGYRYHPIQHKRIFHEGVDFATGKVGPEIYCTGDGVVEKIKYNFFGYGNEVVIDHGFGYKTRYAHMQKITVNRGDVLKRGQLIGTVGNTGASTGPHLHYEVIYRGKQVDPMPFMDLTMGADEYEAMIQTIRNHTEDTK